MRWFGAVVVVVAGCRGSTASIGAEPGGGNNADGGNADGGNVGDGSGRGLGAADGAITGPSLTIRLRGSTARVVHQDGASGETPITQKLGIRSLKLLRAQAIRRQPRCSTSGLPASSAGSGKGRTRSSRPCRAPACRAAGVRLTLTMDLDDGP